MRLVIIENFTNPKKAVLDEGFGHDLENWFNIRSAQDGFMEKWSITEIQHEKHSNELKKMILEYVSKNAFNSISQTQLNRKRIDPYTKNLLVYLFTGTRGGSNRLRIVLLLTERPRNAYQIAKALDLDYNSVEYHIPLLEKNNLILHEGKKYGATYRLSSFLEYNIEAFNEMILKLHKEFIKNAELTL